MSKQSGLVSQNETFLDQWPIAATIITVSFGTFAAYLTRPEMAVQAGSVLLIGGGAVLIWAFIERRHSYRARTLLAGGVVAICLGIACLGLAKSTALVPGPEDSQSQPLPVAQKAGTPGAAQQPGSVGMTFTNVEPDVAQRLGLDFKDHAGAYVTAVDDGAPAKAAGIRPNDVVREFDRRTVTNRSDLIRFIHDSVPGSTVTGKVWRDREAKEFLIVVGTKP